MNRAELVAAIRADALVGRGTCSSLDECYSDDGLWELFSECSDVAAVVEAARDYEERYLEQGLNCRWGDDDDEQLVVYNEWKARRAEAAR